MRRSSAIPQCCCTWGVSARATCCQRCSPPHRLGNGESAVIAYAHAHNIGIVGLDDLQARQLAEELQLTVVGTLGVLLRAKQNALIPAVHPLLDSVVAQGFRLSSELYQDVLQLAQEDV